MFEMHIIVLNAEIWFELCKFDRTISEEFWYITC